MELKYDITKEDYIAFNLNYYTHNAVVQRSILTTRVATAVIVLLAGTALMVWLNLFPPLAIVVYVALAALCFFGTPWYMRHKMIKNVDRILSRANNKSACGPKTLVLRENDFELIGENEDTTYQYEVVQRTASDEGHYYIFVDEFSALIVPFSAFADETQKQEFYARITAHITDEALRC
ncbi:MAG: YcxB family protein [Eubacteriales bacterium]|nr:YcxB family protein [Eubacteriales bacterium]